MAQQFSRQWTLDNKRQKALRDGKQTKWALQFPQLTILRVSSPQHEEEEPKQNSADSVSWKDRSKCLGESD